MQLLNQQYRYTFRIKMSDLKDEEISSSIEIILQRSDEQYVIPTQTIKSNKKLAKKIKALQTTPSTKTRQRKDILIVFNNDNIEVTKELQEKSKKLKKKISKDQKPQTKIRVKNKFFNNLQFQDKQASKKPQTNQTMSKSLIQLQIETTLNKKNDQKPDQLILNKKQQNLNSKKSKFQNLVQKSDFIKARHEFKRFDQDIKYKTYLKKKLKQVQNFEDIQIKNIDIPQISRNKLISSSIYLRNQEANQKKNNHIEIEKQMTAQQRIKQKKLLKKRSYFYTKLNEKINEQRSAKHTQNTTDIQLAQKDKIMTYQKQDKLDKQKVRKQKNTNQTTDENKNIPKIQQKLLIPISKKNY